ncbi:hypothetical protein GY45DRAFT_924296 [Cubamyces sp. BRFM 1775]|nr:hypothetical protein GY45DRAFT_924296 [Cubamyces sp. BRFM 1775]
MGWSRGETRLVAALGLCCSVVQGSIAALRLALAGRSEEKIIVVGAALPPRGVHGRPVQRAELSPTASVAPSCSYRARERFEVSAVGRAGRGEPLAAPSDGEG